MNATMRRQPRGRPGTVRTQAELDAEIARLELEMKSAAANLDFERAAAIRDNLKALRTRESRADRLDARTVTGC